MARILIVEDNPDNMKLFRALLTLKGHHVTALPSGEGLLESLAASRPDLVLMDIQLPGRDGFELLTEIRASAFAGVRVVALTAHAMSGDREKARASGFDEYITKPIDIATFPDLVAKALAEGESSRGKGR
jgi:CheY-like chemotaxis protein